MPQTNGILNGIRVLDLSRMLSGPYCTMMLSDHGAEVIKIESGTGDSSRLNGPFRKDDPKQEWAGYFVSLNRSKKSVDIDLKSQEGKEAFLSLVTSADVVVENFRPGVMERLGLSYETLSELNHRLVYAAIRGFGDPRSGKSPYSDWPSYDVVAQAMGGVMSLTGPDAVSFTKVGPGIGDIFSGMVMAFGIMAALRHAEATGEGQFVDVAMYDAVLSLCERAVYLHDFNGTTPGPEGNNHPFLAPFGLFKAKDGAVAIGVVEDKFWQILADTMGGDSLCSNANFATRAARAEHKDALNSLVETWTKTHTKAELSAMLGGKIPFGPLNSITDIVADPHVAKRSMLAQVSNPDSQKAPWTVASNPLRFSASKSPPLVSPPRLGQHNQQYLYPDLEKASNQLDLRNLRNAFGKFATGVTIITTCENDGTPRGITANSFTSVSLDPPMLLICIAKSAFSRSAFSECEHFGVNILRSTQQDLSALFASKSAEKFDKADYEKSLHGTPVIKEPLANFVCRRQKSVDAGDHLVIFGEVIDFRSNDGSPLLYFNGDYCSIDQDRSE
ncbi:CoA transferase [Paracoccaceae bacterium]|nr:CoA transferase [Paracoccaceae bacterium]